MNAAPQSVFPHTFLDVEITRPTRLRIQKTRRPQTDNDEHCIPQIRQTSRRTNGIAFGVNHTIGTTTENAILANGQQFSSFEQKSDVRITHSAMFHREAIALCQDNGIYISMHPCW